MVSLFGISLYVKTSEQLKQDIEQKLAQGERVTIATVNPEIMLRASRDQSFADALRRCTFRVVDGFGVSFALLLKKKTLIKRITGRMVVEVLYTIAKEKNFQVGVVGGRGLTAMRATERLRKKYGDVVTINESLGAEVEVSNEGIFICGQEIISTNISNNPVDILLLGFGAPKQEYIMTKTKHILPASIQVGVGGLLDVYAGKIKESPRIFQISGLEWLWRLFQEPRRFTRIMNAVIVFTFKAIHSED